MPAEGRARRVLQGIEAVADAEAERGGPRLLAYSGGLACTLLAAVVRKRGEVRYFVAGVEGAADLEAAEVAETFLDYRMERIALSPDRARETAHALRLRYPRLRPLEAMDLVPIREVASRAGAGVLAGFAQGPDSPTFSRALRDASVAMPLRNRTAGLRGISRADLAACARLLGLPPAFSEAPRRRPADGSGVREALRRLAEDANASPRRRRDPHDYH